MSLNWRTSCSVVQDKLWNRQCRNTVKEADLGVVRVFSRFKFCYGHAPLICKHTGDFDAQGFSVSFPFMLNG